MSTIGLKAAFAGIRDGREEGSERGGLAEVMPPRLNPAERRKIASTRAIGAKSTHPDFAPVKVYLRKDTRKQAMRRWEDSTGGDLSELVEHLLTQYLST